MTRGQNETRRGQEQETRQKKKREERRKQTTTDERRRYKMREDQRKDKLRQDKQNKYEYDTGDPDPGRIQLRPRTGAMTRPQRSPEVSAEIESTRSSIVKASSTRQPVAQFLNKPSIPA
ncbi:hypothetical protein DPX16_20156 [Anabarilius grahami]|uniref:Uncharacterized protein n=1 Tax=Anabarilius grahami TaxID=495550 RepID=A0A3N0XQU1_ANAGA|nr:hypothetical protein DPX16_20156 [Anabarilius grahami]